MSRKKQYSIKKLLCKCNLCGNEFSVDTSNDDELVKVFVGGQDYYVWLKMFGENGYLDLLNNLIKEIDINDTISMKTVKKFEDKLNLLTGKTENNRLYFESGKNLCPKCKSNLISINDSEIYETDKLEFLEIDFLK